MTFSPRHALAALVGAGLLWGTTVPLSKLALEWLGPGWLTVARFALAAPVLLLAVNGTRGAAAAHRTRVAAARRTLRAAAAPSVLGWGAVGYGGTIVLQNAGIERTSVSHAALLIGALPVLVVLIAAAIGRGAAGPLGWAGAALALAGVGLVAGRGGGEASLTGDALVLGSVVLSAAFLVAQPGLLAGRDPVAVTAAQFVAAAAAALPLAYALEGLPPVQASRGTVLALLGLVVGGTLVPFVLYAYAQAHVTPETAGAFLNLEPLVGVGFGALAFGDAVGIAQLAGAFAVIAGIALGSTPGRDRLPAAGRAHDVSAHARAEVIRLAP